ncbi:MAG TPA: ATP-binding protein [Polyangiaceae bacterium]|jgi:predicted kinase|nr:ATP-binding protein [Polyangiaceae bacterium]
MATLHFICGSTCAGKTMYASALAQRAKAVRFSIDEWMGALFVPDRPPGMTPAAGLEWMLERIRRCEAQMWPLADQIVARGGDVVFDIGLHRLDDRDRFRARASQTAANIKMHYLDVPVEIRRARVVERSAKRATTLGFDVTPETFEWMEQWFEAPSDDELYGAMIVCE